MKRELLLCIGLFMVTLSQAALHHASEATLEAHMREVNAQWELQGIATPNGDVLVRFGSEKERIAMHLQLVREDLLARHAEGLSADQQRDRQDLLDALLPYYEAGVFPRNHVLPYRNPVFIDPHGTACAVGHLMIASGHRDLAETINREMSTAYLYQILESTRAEEVTAWAALHGFQAEELAWIQPGYPPVQPWVPLGGGANGPVNVLRNLSDGDLLVAGQFTEIGSITTTNVAIWDGVQYMALGNGLGGNITSATQMDEHIYVGGSMLGGGPHDLARWDGNQWTYHTIFEGKFPSINALHVHDGELYAAGEAMGFAGVDHGVRQVIDNGDSYVSVGSNFNGRVLTMETYLGFLVAGGEFTGSVGPTDPLLAYVALLEGNEWSQLADGTDAPVRDLLAAWEELYLGGDLFVNGVTTFGLARLTSMGTDIVDLLPVHEYYMDETVVPSEIRSLAMHDGDLYIAGRFMIDGILTLMGNNVARFSGGPDPLEPMILVDNDVNTVAVDQGELVIGGLFENWLPFVATLDISTSMMEPERLDLLVHPNPAMDQLTIETEGMEMGTVCIIDVAGRIVATPGRPGSDRMNIDVKDLARGTYTVRITAAGVVREARFVKQ